MIKCIEFENFYGFKAARIAIHPERNIMVGINGAGKSNFFKAINLLRHAVGGEGLREHVLTTLGGFDNIVFQGYGEKSAERISLTFTFDGEALSKIDPQAFPYREDAIYTIVLVKQASSANFYVEESLRTSSGYEYLKFSNGKGIMREPAIDAKHWKTVSYSSDAQELYLREVGDIQRYPAQTTLKWGIKDIAVYTYFDTTWQSPIRSAVLPTGDRRLLESGRNLAQILNTIKINHKSKYDALVAMLREVNPHFDGLDFRPIGNKVELMLSERRLEKAIHVSSISDGTLRYLCLLAILYNPDRGRLVCIDEPEVGLHPDMLAGLAEATAETGGQTTWLISTHSAELLNYFDIAHLRVFEKDEDNCSLVRQYSEADFADWYEAYALGRMWKEGDLGGVRYGN